MDADKALEIVKQILAEYFELDEGDIDADANLANEYGIDSLQLLDLMMAVQERTGVVIPEEPLIQVATANEAAALLRSLAGMASSDPS